MSTSDNDELVFLPLGGTGEIGMNLNLYGCRGKWLIVDLGVSFGDDSMPGVEVFMPDPGFIADRRKDLLGIVLTHGHEDHLGAVAHLWPRLRCPVYASPFTASLLRTKLVEAHLEDEVEVHVVPLGGAVRLGPFGIEFVTQTHSIPEPNSLAIDTPFGRVLHTGDWKFDPRPLIGAPADEKRLAALGDEGVLALVGDSTNVFKQGAAGSESDVRDSLTELLGRYRGRIAVACFATNVARLESIAVAAAAHDRHVALVGRSLWRIEKAARENGYLKEIPEFLTEHDAAYLPEDKVVYICTGSQGEPRAALARIANDTHPHVTLKTGDVVIFSSRIIPGNERSIFRLQNQLIRQGVEVVTEKDHFVHVSGHPGRDEMCHLYELVRPRISVPVHGEARHLQEHAQLAKDCGVPETAILQDGEMLRLAPGPVEVVDFVSIGRLAVDGTRLVTMDSVIMRDRHRMVHNGSAVVTIVLDRLGSLLGDPQISAHGLLDAEQEADAHEAVVDAVRDAIEEMPRSGRQNDDLVREATRLALRRHMKQSHGKKPLTDVHLVRV
ncbi:ribonuclease J [Telmatospirillum siberiense]|uniref:MBL fold hydrolase n=1 Tax=Telmatospirillum siberiense TaxID=382514 RepID=A0A2N3PZI6_9PROT|nr:ribonuclease J [Telmatospirillum siberiense]PKU25827.1 MBL fold hydrolase [Telmatospirillum siberiense]